MTSESGLSISKPTSVLKKSVKVNFKDFSKALGEGLVDLGFGKWDSLAGDGVEALSALGLAANAEEIGWLLVYRSLLQAMKNLIDEKTELEPDKFDVKALQTGINEALETSSLTINKKFFEHPDKDSIVDLVKPAFVKWLKQRGLSEANAQVISDRLPIYFATALHDEWVSHAKDYVVLKERLDTSFTQANESFISMVSSEFRTPMTTIQSSAELLERYGNRFSEEKTQSHLRRIQEALSQMTQLLDNVLLVSKAEAGKLKFEPSAMDVVAFCRDIVESIQINARPKHTINLVVQGDCTNAQMDKKLLGHIIINLLSNAIKYSPQVGTVQFDLICNSSSAVFRIQDTGIGIPKQDIENLFDSFRQASNAGSAGTIPGTGLGLSIVKSCVNLHGGQIVVESEVGIGSTFIVTLPLN